MSTPGNPVVMVDPQGNVGQVAADKVESARSSGYRDAVKMVGPDGKQGYVASDKVDAARKQNFMIAPDSGVKMITPQGKITYALPSEVGQFEDSGHRRVDQQGRVLATQKEDAESRSRMLAVSGLTGLTTGMTPEEKADFQTSRASGHVSALATAGTEVAAPSIAFGAGYGSAALQAGLKTPLGKELAKKAVLGAAQGVGLTTAGVLGWKWLKNLL